VVTNTLNRASAVPAGPLAEGPLKPVSMTVRSAIRYSGIGRTRLYHLLASGQLQGLKLNRRTLILTASLDDFVKSLPAAEVNPRYGS
jgi:hypothetical protein